MLNNDISCSDLKQHPYRNWYWLPLATLMVLDRSPTAIPPEDQRYLKKRQLLSRDSCSTNLFCKPTWTWRMPFKVVRRPSAFAGITFYTGRKLWRHVTAASWRTDRVQWYQLYFVMKKACFECFYTRLSQLSTRPRIRERIKAWKMKTFRLMSGVFLLLYPNVSKSILIFWEDDSTNKIIINTTPI